MVLYFLVKNRKQFFAIRDYPTQLIAGFRTSLQTIPVQSSGQNVGLRTIDGPGLILDGVTNVFALIRQLIKNHKRFLARTFYSSLGNGSPIYRIIHRGLYLEPFFIEGYTFYGSLVSQRVLLRKTFQSSTQNLLSGSVLEVTKM